MIVEQIEEADCSPDRTLADHRFTLHSLEDHLVVDPAHCFWTMATGDRAH